MSNNLTQRLFTGVVGVVVLMFGIHYNQWGYFALFLVVSTFSLWEFYTLVGGSGHLPLKIWGTVCSISLYTLSFLVVEGIAPIHSYTVLAPLFFISFLSRLYKKDSIDHFSNLGYTFLGIIYCCFPFTMLHLMIHTDGGYDPSFVTGLLFLHWASDTGAYFSGKLFGKKKLFERISPKKTWEGTIGGLLLTIITAFTLSVIFPEIAQRHWLSISILVVVFGTYGDLVESMFKRELEIKDSGHILLGHGGFLDRFDCFFLSLPFITVYHQFLM